MCHIIKLNHWHVPKFSMSSTPNHSIFPFSFLVSLFSFFVTLFFSPSHPLPKTPSSITTPNYPPSLATTSLHSFSCTSTLSRLIRIEVGCSTGIRQVKNYPQRKHHQGATVHHRCRCASIAPINQDQSPKNRQSNSCFRLSGRARARGVWVLAPKVLQLEINF